MPPAAPGANGYYPPPMQQRPPFPGTLPPQSVNGNPYGTMAPAPSTQLPGQPSVPGFPPHIQTLMNQAQATQTPPPGQFNPPSQSPPAQHAAATQNNYAQLMAFLVSRDLFSFQHNAHTKYIAAKSGLSQ